jgi:SSU ribosomal protein S12P
VPWDGGLNVINEHDEVVIERIGGSEGRAYGDLPGVRLRLLRLTASALRLYCSVRSRSPLGKPFKPVIQAFMF